MTSEPTPSATAHKGDSEATLHKAPKPKKEQAKNEPKWDFEAQLKADQAALEAVGVDPTQHAFTLTWDGLCVRGRGGADDVHFQKDVSNLLMPWRVWTTGNRAAKISQARAGAATHDPRLKKGERFLLDGFSGALAPGEMMLVVGRPGSGCSTFLKALSGHHGAYAGVDGAVYYGSLKAKDRAFRPLRGEVAFVSEDEVHDPNLTVGETMDFAVRMEAPSKRARAHEDGKVITSAEYTAKAKHDVLNTFHIANTHDTKVGDQFVRGVSGGERKRVTLAEAYSTHAQVQCWDNATRGLDANTALQFVRICRTLCDVGRRINVLSLYQAGNSMYERFDKVTVIAEGQVIYYGPRAEARGYFEALGLEHMDGANTADFLTAATAANERKVRAGFEGRVPNTAAEFAAAYKASEVAQRMRAEVDAVLADTAAREEETRNLKEYVALQKSSHAFKGLAQKASYLQQIHTATIRHAQQRWGDQWSFWARQVTTLVMGLVNGSVFYKVSETTTGLYLRAGVIFMTMMFPAILGFSDVAASFQGRAVTAKHKAYSMYRPSVILLAQTLVDLPIYLFQNLFFVIVTYWMADLRHDAGQFFICFAATFLTALIFSSIFRAIGYAFNNFHNASKMTGAVFLFMIMYGGFAIYTPSMHPWFAWIRWLSPVYYGFEAMVAGQLDGLKFECAPPLRAPYGPGYEGKPAGCALPGAEFGTTVVDGTEYLRLVLEFSTSHVGRNFGIIIVLWIASIALGMWFLERLPAAGSSKAVTVYKRGGGGALKAESVVRGTAPRDEEEGGDTQVLNEKANGAAAEKASTGAIATQGTTFTWQDICYTVPTRAGDLQLLDHVTGYCKAGTITALMGSSGAGKTTLMDVLAARKSEGTITGTVTLNGRPLPVSFQRTTGYCEQLDVHLPQATVREALEFSALLRQPRSLSDKEKLAYVDTIVELLELEDIQDAIIGVPGEGLSIEQRKRLNIGVELVSRPTLLFLDEPTSGLDGQSSFLIVSFLRKLAATGQSILCTIHQPSAALFAGFDQLLLLKGGGRTVYFGAIAALKEYFVARGVPWPQDVNPAEFMIDIVSGEHSLGRDWADVWLESEERAQMVRDLEALKAASAAGAPAIDEADDHEFAATTWTQMRLVMKRASVQLYRDFEYVANKFALHILVGLISGFSFYQLGNSYADLQNRLFTIVVFVFVAPGVIVQTQPKFIANRDIFETREKKAKFYSWQCFVVGEIVAEWPYLVLCAFLYFVCWYFAAGLDLSAGAAGPVFLQMVLYEALYTGIGQFVAAYAPNPVFAALVLPLLLGTLMLFAGVIIPYQAITAFWRYWLYYLNPFTYLMEGLLVWPIWDVKVHCKDYELGYFFPPANMTCGEYMAPFMKHASGYLKDPTNKLLCAYCGYSQGSEYLATMEMKRRFDGWKGVLITLLFCISSYGFVFLLLKLRSKATKTAK
ncbi:hypothetical protein Q8F55_002425 [Vanrija albida]|uniref:ABC transporter domain-containing protein n=1 Tax=Vanrija albida TaxID=181172 RepID=A0ABR3Q9S5_9TREE